jgi:glycosyltransferase involved in cell wall biosynthesis
MLGQTDQLWSWMKGANLLVSVSLVEGNPNVVLEAAAVQCPLVLSDIPAHRELFDEHSAFFVSPSSPDEIAQGILQTLQNSDFAAKKAYAASLIASKRPMDTVVSEYLELYEEALAD